MGRYRRSRLLLGVASDSATTRIDALHTVGTLEDTKSDMRHGLRVFLIAGGCVRSPCPALPQLSECQIMH